MGEENTEQKNPEYEKLLKKQQAQEAQLNFLIQQQQQWEQSLQEQAMQMEAEYTDSTRVMVSKQCLKDLYFCLFIGNERDALSIIDTLCSSISAFQGQVQEGRMLVDKQLMQNLKYCHVNQDSEGMYVYANEICRTLSVGQRREIVNSLVNELMQRGSMEDISLINSLKDSIGNPDFFRTG